MQAGWNVGGCSNALCAIPGPLTRFPGLYHAGLNAPARGEESKVRVSHTANPTPVHEG